MATAEHTLSKGRWRRIVKHPAVRIAVPIVIVVIAIFALNSLAAHVKWVDVKADLVAASSVSLFTALAFTALSFVGISFYDALAVNLVAPSKVPFRIAALAGVAGYAISGLLGVSYLTGTAVRISSRSILARSL